MTLPDPSLDRSGIEPANRQDSIPNTERNQDPGRAGVMHELETGGSRPLTREEKEAAEHDEPLPERVYAPASERVPREPAPGHRDFVEHTDTSTPERQATGATPADEPSFTRVARPSATAESTFTSTGPASGAYDYSYQAQPSSTSRKRLFLGVGIGWVVLSISAAAGAWFYIRWRREQNKPINRLRRQARQAASEIRERVPATPEEAVQPAAGLLAALLSTALVVWRRARAQSSPTRRKFQKSVESISDADWQQRLIALKQRWTPRRVELEKVSISRH